MIIANATQIARFTGKAAYPTGAFISDEAAQINEATLRSTGGKLPCYVSRIGARGAAVWVSIGSSARIGKGEAEKMIARLRA